MNNLKILPMLALGIIMVGSGCSSMTGFDISTCKQPDFKITDYQRALIREDKNTEIIFIMEMEIYLNNNNIASVNDEILQPKDMIVDLKTKWGMCRPNIGMEYKFYVPQIRYRGIY